MAIAQWEKTQPRSQAVAAIPGRHSAALEALADATHWATGTFRTWRRRLRERDQLARLSDRMLSDIGITRAEAQFLGNKPFWKE
jgi:uncharacterized protein YjiS (DUF1127 family)